MAVFRGKMVDAIRQTFARGALALLHDAAAAVVQPAEPFGSPEANEMERAHHGALSPRCRRRDVSGALPQGWPDQNARLAAWDGERVTFTYRARQEEADGGPPLPHG